MDKIRIDSLRSIRIARLADAEVDCVVFDVSPWREAYPALTNYRVEVTSPGGIVYLPAKVALAGDDLTWTITAEDTASAGNGLYQIVATGTGGEHKTSASAVFAVRATMPGTAEDTPPDPAKPWVDKIVEAAQRVEDATVHPPIIGENGNWWLWDFEASAYVDSRKPSQGGGSGGGGIAQETDPTVPAWAKQPNPPTYTAADVGAQPAGDYALKSEIPAVPVQSVNGKTGDVKLNAEDVGAASSEDVARLSEEKADQFTVGSGLQMSEDRVLSAVGGGSEGVYELIDTITVGNDIALIDKTAEPDGTPYNFLAVMVTTETSGGESGDLRGTSQLLSKTGASIGVTQNYKNASYAWTTKTIVDISDGVWEARGYCGGKNSSSTMYGQTNASGVLSVADMPRIERVRFVPVESPIMVDTIIKIYGVRA